MKSKEEILNSYYSQGADGMPEISADGLLKAMDEYRNQAEEQAFNAARELNDTDHTYPTFAIYKASLEKAIEPKDNLADGIRLIADSILPQFLPNDPNAQKLSFNLKTNGITYTAYYSKNIQGYWEFQDYTG
ncbi:hypothetical protein [Mucilaginibacter sp.]|uniref:hypothetical protein n=1 Tax=Mucilaginibacter sp. TaxID=1882438 RepID=UPI00356A2D2D